MKSPPTPVLFILLGLALAFLTACGADGANEPTSTRLMFSFLIAILFLLLFLLFPLLYKWAKLSDLNYALGLPQGSIRAIIALGLILLFAITSNHLFAELVEGSEQTVTLPDPPAFAVLASSGVIITNIVYHPTGTKIDVTIKNPADPQSFDFAKQLLTTLSTLVVAIAGFYFGTRAVSTARGAVETTAPSISFSESSPATPKSDARELDFKLKVDPPGEAANWKIDGDKEGKLMQIKPGEFKYMPGKPAGETVGLVFELVNYPDVKKTLEVKVPDAWRTE